MKLVIEISDEMWQAVQDGWVGNELWHNALANGIPLSENNPIIQYEGKTYIADKLTMKTKDKDGYYSFYGFKEVDE